MISRQLTLILLIFMVTIWGNCNCFTTHSRQFSISNVYSFSFVNNIEERHRLKVPLHLSSTVRKVYDESLLEIESKLREIVNKKDIVTLRNQALVERIDDLVEQRAEARRQQEYANADNIRDEIMKIELIQDGKQLKLMIEDIPHKQGGGSTWNVISMDEEGLCDEKSDMSDDQTSLDDEDQKSVIQLAHMALGLAVHASSIVAREGYDHHTIEYFQKELISITEQALYQLKNKGEMLSGRKAADAAFWFALAGVTEEDLFNELTLITAKELIRFGERSSCRPQDIAVMVERLSAAGVTGQNGKLVESIANKCLNGKETKIISEYTQVDLHSTQSLMWIWRFSTKQRKLKAFQKNASRHWEMKQTEKTKLDNNDSIKNIKKPKSDIDFKGHETTYVWGDIFDNPTKPLIIDIGCGMGVSLLGLARFGTDTSDNNSISHSLHAQNLNITNWSECNFLGYDLSYLATEYANGIAKRWGLNHKLHFCVGESEKFLQNVIETYPGPIHLIMIQYPTPFRFQRTSPSLNKSEPSKVTFTSSNETRYEIASIGNGNSQLPINATSGFMVTKQLLQIASNGLSEEGHLLIQSNCEDVAVYVRNLACSNKDGGHFHFEGFEKDSCVQSLNGDNRNIPKRTLEWIQAGGERAIGAGWSKDPLIPTIGATETEVACMKRNIPIHRCLLTPTKRT